MWILIDGFNLHQLKWVYRLHMECGIQNVALNMNTFVYVVHLQVYPLCVGKLIYVLSH
jgi:hypothetical protein